LSHELTNELKRQHYGASVPDPATLGPVFKQQGK